MAVPVKGADAGGSARRQATQAAGWTLVGYALSQLLRLAANVVLARLLAPGAFGLMTLVAVILTGLQMFSDIGIGPSLTRSALGEEPFFRNTAWTMQVVRGVILWAATCALAWPAAVFYHPDLALLLPVCGVTAVILGFCSTSVYILNRRMDLRRITFLELASQVVGLAITMTWAFVQPSVWALVAGTIASSVVRAGMSYLLIPGWVDRFQWDDGASRELVSFGRWIFISTVLTFLGAQIDRLMLGRLLTIDELGVYSVALGVATLPREIVVRLATSVQFPALSRQVHADQGGRFAQAFRQSRAALLTLGLTSTLAVALGAQAFFSFLYVKVYLDAVWIVQLLSLSMWIFCLQATADRALLARGDSLALAWINLARLVVTSVGCLAGYRAWGLPGFLLGLSAGTLAGHVVTVAALWRAGISTLRADLGYTALFCLGLGLPAGLSWASPRPYVYMGVDLLGLAAAAVVLAPLGLWSVRRIRELVSRR